MNDILGYMLLLLMVMFQNASLVKPGTAVGYVLGGLSGACGMGFILWIKSNRTKGE